MPLEYANQDGADALGQNQYVDALDGTYWSDGWDATTGSGDFEVDIAPGSGAFEGDDIETTSTETVDLSGDVDPDDPRKAVVYVTSGESVDYDVGDAESALPTNQTREKTYQPEPPADVSGVVVAEVWLGADASVVVSDDIRDRRVSNDAVGTIGVPSGLISMWSGAIDDIPDGWTLCDGTDETPDLTDRFVVGAGDGYNVDDTGGQEEVQLSISELPSHDHGYTDEYRTPSGDDEGSQFGEGDLGSDDKTTDSVGDDEAHENRPPYYALAYIMKV